MWRPDVRSVIVLSKAYLAKAHSKDEQGASSLVPQGTCVLVNCCVPPRTQYAASVTRYVAGVTGQLLSDAGVVTHGRRPQ